MLKKMCFIIGFFILAFPLLAQSFDCNKPDFGARIEDLNKDGFFIKYMEKGGISYYNYTGSCRLDIHEKYNPSIAYAFIDNQLYARIITISEREDSIEDIRSKIEKNVFKQIGTAPHEIKQDGDWWIYQWFNEKDNLRYKVKINSKTKVGKGAFYYEPLHAKLPNLKEDNDPVSLRH
ncbi:MAG: hypothetical protein NTU74_20975 [Deltaproteobacteria bacterium]|nr:hypothetical protein [Deltaproteobacteria bacterium]